MKIKKKRSNRNSQKIKYDAHYFLLYYCFKISKEDFPKIEKVLKCKEDDYLDWIYKQMSFENNRYYRIHREVFYLVCIGLFFLEFLILILFLNAYISLFISTLTIGYIEYFYYKDYLVIFGKKYVKYYKVRIKVKYKNNREVKALAMGRDAHGNFFIKEDLEFSDCTNVKYTICDKRGMYIAFRDYILGHHRNILGHVVNQLLRDMELDYYKLR